MTKPICRRILATVQIKKNIPIKIRGCFQVEITKVKASACNVNAPSTVKTLINAAGRVTIL
ncbi:hypothetical protein RO3G_15448 [Rhizopus delemar RA 99-880]|uniref:Uncharacterized protein n=1 Tax=Rhizopus delemar (strain RA 99-880 / ATCC MYA-4621 / FGSC 9543 / NRRL 43880) TaxID=246409 RepID=I1CQK7_RHIO9|nr:hypothetical protein RO3G_15448 [Rhizopus delemar RA 99-880]|eukprot:EIE90737.1 hypothetical protein RO3G_15448 [Rhizopus delemar RA 99-880]